MHNMQASQSWGLPNGLVIENPARQEMGIQSLGQEDHLAEEKALLQYSCLINHMDRGATVPRVAKSRTQLSPHTRSLLF